MDIISAFPPDVHLGGLVSLLTISSSPVAWAYSRGDGWVELVTMLTFADGIERQVSVMIGKFSTYPGFIVELRLKSDLLVELGLLDNPTPTVGRVKTFLPKIGASI